MALAASAGCWLASAPAHAAAAPAGPPPTAVRTQPDPFLRLRTIDEGHIASSWSSLPASVGCRDGDDGITGHVLGLAESTEAAQDMRTGSFDLVDPR
jgi:hypothetical protein